MQVYLLVGDTMLLALIDSGSTHNFLADDAARSAGLQLYERTKVQVRVANGDKVPCQGIYCAARFSIDDKTFTDDFFALQLAGYDVVLGTRVLASLG